MSGFFKAVKITVINRFCRHNGDRHGVDIHYLVRKPRQIGQRQFGQIIHPDVVGAHNRVKAVGGFAAGGSERPRVVDKCVYIGAGFFQFFYKRGDRFKACHIKTHNADVGVGIVFEQTIARGGCLNCVSAGEDDPRAKVYRHLGGLKTYAAVGARDKYRLTRERYIAVGFKPPFCFCAKAHLPVRPQSYEI